MGQFHGPQPDCGKVGAHLLPRLGAFDQNAARLASQPAVIAHAPHALQQAVRTLYALQCDGATAYCDGALADIERADRLGSDPCSLDVAPVRPSWRSRGPQPLVGEQFGNDLACADHLAAALFYISEDPKSTRL